MQRENFIPFSKRDLLGHLAQRIGDLRERELFVAFCAMAETLYHAQFYEDLEKLKAAYVTLDPDRISGTIPGLSPAAEPAAGAALLDRVKRVLTKANYREIPRARIQQAFESASPWGLQLKVDLDRYDLLALYSREEYPEHGEKKTLFLRRKFDYSIFRQVVLVFRLNEASAAAKKDGRKGQGRYRSDKVYLKLFKNVPTVDLEMLFPDTEIEIRLFDKLKVVLPLAIGVFSSLYKILGFLLGQGGSQRPWTQVGFWALVGGLFGVALKGFLGYRNTVEKYLKALTESLYFQNLDNNSGVFKYLLDEAEEEECKEMILGYHFLHLEQGENYGEAALDARIERYFRDELDAEIDFEVEDSLRKLAALELLIGEGETLKVLPLQAALERLERRLVSLASRSSDTSPA